jgi:hypothetical protein
MHFASRRRCPVTTGVLVLVLSPSQVVAAAKSTQHRGIHATVARAVQHGQEALACQSKHGHRDAGRVSVVENTSEDDFEHIVRKVDDSRTRTSFQHAPW